MVEKASNDRRTPRRILTYKTLRSVGVDYTPQYIRRLPDFPAAVQLSAKRIGFFEDEVLAWVASRPRVQRKAATADQDAHKDQPDADIGKTVNAANRSAMGEG